MKLIMTDQLRGDALHCMGNEAVISPHIDQLAQEGLLEQGQNTAYIDVESTKIWLESNGKYTKEELADMSEMDIKMANIGSNVFIAVDASLLDAMEDVTIAVNI